MYHHVVGISTKFSTNLCLWLFGQFFPNAGSGNQTLVPFFGPLFPMFFSFSRTVNRIFMIRMMNQSVGMKNDSLTAHSILYPLRHTILHYFIMWNNTIHDLRKKTTTSNFQSTENFMTSDRFCGVYHTIYPLRYTFKKHVQKRFFIYLV